MDHTRRYDTVKKRGPGKKYSEISKKCFGQICQLGMKLDTVEASFSHRLHDLRTTGILSKDQANCDERETTDPILEPRKSIYFC